jgi:DDE family transposase
MDTNLDCDLWRIVCRSIHRAARAIRSPGRRPVYSPRLIVTMYCWAVLHDQCLSWACSRVHCSGLFRPRRLPSVSQFTRRIKGMTEAAILQRVNDDLAGRGVPLPLHYLDGKSLLVSNVSKDPDAQVGHICRAFARGYKLHAYINENRRIRRWCVTPLNTHETVAAQALLAEAAPPSDHGSSLTLADRGYDAAALYQLHAANGNALLTPLRGLRCVNPQGRSAGTLRAMGPERREAMELWENHPALARYVMKKRFNVENVFSVLVVSMKLHALPGFVRRISRVRRWVGAKIILYHARLLAQERAAKKAQAT